MIRVVFNRPRALNLTLSRTFSRVGLQATVNIHQESTPYPVYR
uniref:Uncharacterized protein n=1 Tax=Anopheles dirus TaxID=7168 RepID=A0A182NXL1_9DIPT